MLDNSLLSVSFRLLGGTGKLIENPILNELRKLGYQRDDSFSSATHHREIINQNYEKKTLSHSFFDWCTLLHTNFNYAAVTGSFFSKCKFDDCSMYQADFEFCTFNNCRLSAKNKIISSFNNCDFSDCFFNDSIFQSCTFTGATFQNCEFENIQIINSTLENALFFKCSFKNMNLRSLNMDFVQLVKPRMDNVVLPFSQIPYMFGCLEYLSETQDDVRISSGNDHDISPSEYFDLALPKLADYWSSMCSSRSEFYFPLSNTYIASHNYMKALSSLSNGLQASVLATDYRMLKFYCKLISRSNLFDQTGTHKFYDHINRFAPKNRINSPQMRSFMRNIGEIRAELFTSYETPKLIITYKTDMSLSDNEKVGVIIGKLFSYVKMSKAQTPNYVEIKLSENSPLLISTSISGTEENIVALLPIMLHISGMDIDDIMYLCPGGAGLIETQALDSSTNSMYSEANILIDELRSLNVNIMVSEYSLENIENIDESRIAVPYYSAQYNAQALEHPLNFLNEG
jgi:uncharacterized protein YjbI with pentapeptide repeats